MLFGASENNREYRGAKITIKGTQYNVIGYPSINRSLENIRSSCSVEVEQDIPSFPAGEAVPAWVDMNFGSKGVVRVFTGYLGSTTAPFGSRTINVVDILFRLKNSPEMGCTETEAIFFNNLSPDAAILKVLMSSGIPESSIDTASLISALTKIAPSGSLPDDTMTVCPLMPYCIEVNQPLDTLYKDLCTFLCIAGYCDASGKVLFVPIDTRPSASPQMLFDNDSSSGYPIIDGQRSKGGFDDVVRVCTCKLAVIQVGGVQGADYTSKWIATAVENGVPYDVSISAPLVQTTGMADRLTKYYGELGCRQETKFTIETARDPHLKPGIHAMFRYNYPSNSPLFPSNTAGYIIEVDDSGTKAKLTVSTGASAESGYQQGMLPVASFTFQVIMEQVKIAGVSTTIYDVILDGSLSSDPDGTITSYVWGITGTTPITAPASEAKTMAVLPSLTGVSVSLAVTDDNPVPNTVTITQALDADSVVVQCRKLNTTINGQWAVLPGTKWVKWSPPATTATAVARYNEKGDLWCGCANGAIYKRSQDDLTANPVLVTTLDSSITDIYVGEPFQNESAINSIIVAHGSKATWTHDAFASVGSYTFGAPVKGVAIDAYTTTHLSVLTGATVKESWDDGSTWTTLIEGGGGSSVEDIAPAPWDTCAVFSGTTGSDIVKFSSGASWSGATISGDIKTVTPGVTTETFRVATSTGYIYLFTKTGATYNVTEIGSVPSGNTKRIVRDGSLSAVYGADSTMAFKQLNDDPLQTYTLETGLSLRIGYAGIGAPVNIEPWGNLFTTIALTYNPDWVNRRCYKDYSKYYLDWRALDISVADLDITAGYWSFNSDGGTCVSIPGTARKNPWEYNGSAGAAGGGYIAGMNTKEPLPYDIEIRRVSGSNYPNFDYILPGGGWFITTWDFAWGYGWHTIPAGSTHIQVWSNNPLTLEIRKKTT